MTKVDSTGTTAVDSSYHWLKMDTCPIGTKVQVCSMGGIAMHTIWDGKAEWAGWAPLPTFVNTDRSVIYARNPK